jgi:hypothetical protein
LVNTFTDIDPNEQEVADITTTRTLDSIWYFDCGIDLPPIALPLIISDL